MNKDIENLEEGIRLTIPLLTQEEINKIDININEITEQFTKMVIKDKDLAIAQYIMDKQQKMLEQKQSILDKVTDKLKEDIEIYKGINELTEKEQIELEYAQKLLNIIEGEKNNGRLL